MSRFYTGCPVACRAEVPLVEFVSAGGEPRRIDFTKAIVWLQETEGSVRFMHGGKVLHTGSTYTDFYGYCSSFRSDVSTNFYAIADAYQITPESSLELVVEAFLFRTPVLETEVDKRENDNRTDPRYKRRYTYLPGDCRIESPNPMSDADERPLWYPQLQREQIDTAIAWSSKNTFDQNLALYEALCKKWSVNQ